MSNPVTFSKTDSGAYIPAFTKLAPAMNPNLGQAQTQDPKMFVEYLRSDEAVQEFEACKHVWFNDLDVVPLIDGVTNQGFCDQCFLY